MILARMLPLHWRMARGYRLPSSERDQPYYISWSAAPQPHGEGWSVDRKDAAGVILYENVYHPVRIIQYGLYEYENALKGSAQARSAFLAQARYLSEHQKADGAYPYPRALPEYSAPAGWISAMAQGEAASLLVRAYALSGDEKFAESAVLALNPLRKDVAVGGASFLRERAVFFEEYASLKACHVLNGHLYAAFGVWDVIRFGLADASLQKLHEAAVETLDGWLGYFDAEGWSYYHLARDTNGRRHYAPLWYHQFHIAQLHIYAAMTGRQSFQTMATKWEGALSNLSVRARVWRYGAYRVANALFRRAKVAKPIVWQPMAIR